VSNVDEVLIEVRPGRTRTALLEAGRLVELIVEDENNPSLVGNIYLGRVEKVIDSLNAAFIDLGLDRSGFLAMAEARPAGETGNARDAISKHLCEGDGVVVQVLRDGFEDKGPKLTTRLALTSRSVILTPGDPVIRLSRRIEDKAARSRLEKLLKGLAGPGEGFIVRTAAVQAPVEDISAEIGSLREAVSSLQAGRAAASPPSLLRAEAGGALRALRDLVPRDVTRVLVDDTQAFHKAKAYLQNHAPGLLGRLALHQGPGLLLGDDDLADDLESALAAKIPLPGGGTVIFSETPALVAIDVNVGGGGAGVGGGREQSALKTNLQAAREIARHIRLRNLSGLLVIDFVSMKSKDNAKKLLTALRNEVSGDPNQVFVGGFTRFGLVELTRKRDRPSLAASLGSDCPACAGSGGGLSAQSVAYMALDHFAQATDAAPGQGLEIRTSQRVAEALAGSVRAALLAVQERLGRRVTTIVDPQVGDGEYEIVRRDINEAENIG